MKLRDVGRIDQRVVDPEVLRPVPLALAQDSEQSVASVRAADTAPARCQSRAPGPTPAAAECRAARSRIAARWMLSPRYATPNKLARPGDEQSARRRVSRARRSGRDAHSARPIHQHRQRPDQDDAAKSFLRAVVDAVGTPSNIKRAGRMARCRSAARAFINQPALRALHPSGILLVGEVKDVAQAERRRLPHRGSLRSVAR
jgi:hypothetical protein